MTLRTRLTLAGGAAVLAALAIASVVIYFAVESKLHEQIDASLITTAEDVGFRFTHANGKPVPPQSSRAKLPPGTYPKKLNPSFPSGPYVGSEGSAYFQIIPNLASAARSTQQPVKPTSLKTTPKAAPTNGSGTRSNFVALAKTDGLVASGLQPPYFRDVTYLGRPMRLYTMQLHGSRDGLVRVARPLTEANSTLARIRWLLLALTLGGAVVAAALGRLAAAAVLRPVRRLAAAVQEVTTSRDLEQRIEVSGRDEIASLAANFNAMLGALDHSQQTQQQLIADASHELRTPLTAHRTNIELLARPDLPPDGRNRALTAAIRGIDDLSALVNDLIHAARNGKQLDARERVEFHSLAAAAVRRAKRRAPQTRFAVKLEPCIVSGAPARLERALDNVLDNATKWNDNGQPIEVTLTGGRLTVRDHGSGIDENDLPHVFDRFYRAAAARSMPGSGLGLAIVKQTVDDHGGSVSVANAEGGGAVVLIALPLDE